MKKNLINLVISCAALFSCTANSDEPELSSGLSVECYSRQTEYSESAPVKDFAMFVMDGESPYDGVSNPVHVTYGTSWNYPVVKLSEKVASVSAFYPYIEGSSYTNIPMDLSKQIDYMSSSVYEVSNKNPEVTFTMDHLLACLEFSVDSSKEISLLAKGIETSGSYNLKTCTIEFSGTKADIESDSKLLLNPSNKKISLEITYKGHKYNYDTPVVNFEKGKKYTFNLKVDNSQNLVIVGNVVITDWKSGGDYTGIVKP